jgi:predicted Zn-ribbon and HTH transcriptional regulator
MDKKNPPPIPSLPDSEDELFALLSRKFKVIIEKIREIKSEPPESSVVFRGVKCKICGMHFVQEFYKSVLGERFSSCPNCKFPQNVLDEFAKLEELEKE